MSRPNRKPLDGLTAESSLSPLAAKDGEPVFDESWQAQALALAHLLVEKDVFTANQWSDALGSELICSERKAFPDNAETYYLSVLKALEKLANEIPGVSASELDWKTEAWRNAYLNTPHGNPVELPPNEKSGTGQGN